MHYLTTEAFPRIAYRKYGSGPAVVLLHGFPADGTLWDNVYPGLTHNFTVIIPDLPGTGQSEAMKGDLTIAHLADMVSAILDQENIAVAVLAGHSMGGYIAAAFADKYTSVLKGLSLVHSTTMPDDDERKEVRKKVIGLIQKGGKDAFIRQMVPNLFAVSFRSAYPDVVERQVDESLKLPSDTLVDFYSAMMTRPDRTDVLQAATFPVQWVLGKDDTIIVPVKALKLSVLAPINFVNLYHECGHMSMIEKPALLIRDLNEFLQYCYQ